VTAQEQFAFGRIPDGFRDHRAYPCELPRASCNSPEFKRAVRSRSRRAGLGRLLTEIATPRSALLPGGLRPANNCAQDEAACPPAAQISPAAAAGKEKADEQVVLRSDMVDLVSEHRILRCECDQG